MRVHVKSELCAGHGRCYTEAPEIFSARSDGFVEEQDQAITVKKGSEEEARVAVAACPEQAISLIED